MKPILLIAAIYGASVTAVNSQCLLDSVFINALLVDPSGSYFNYDTNDDGLINSNDEFVEICNSSSETVDVSGWRIGDDDPPPFPDFQIPSNTFLAPGKCLVMVANYCPDMPAVCTTPEGVLNMNYQFSGFLGNSGDVISLVDTLGNSCSVVYGSTLCSQVDLLEIPDFDINTCDDWGGDIDGCPLLAIGDSCDYEPVVLPIEFLSLDLFVSKNNSVKINWSVIESQPDSKYYIQWSENLNMPFINIGVEQSQGNISGTNYYEFEHLEPNIGLNFYRIVQEELSGLTTTSPVLVGEVRNNLVGRAHPSLVSSIFYISGNSDFYRISILDMSGRLIMTKSQILDQETINIEGIENGYYILNVTSSNGFFSQPIVKI